MLLRNRWIPPLAVGIAGVVILVSLFSTSLSGWPFVSILAAVGVIQVVVLLPAMTAGRIRLTPEDQGGRTEAEQLLEQREQIEELRARTLALLDEQTRRVSERERALAERLTRLHEVLDYPVDDPHDALSSEERVRLSDRDRQVNAMLESEAERVYEKIRINGYMTDGRLDLPMIRDELQQLIVRIAQIYSPDSKNPLLETSFEQLARAASRICLHALVLMEQLPLKVQQYNFNSLYAYLRAAVQGYGAYKSATPWLKYLSRGVYAGRVLSTASPLTMGAWWLASEVGRKGAQKLVENVIDRQAVAVLHDLVTVVGVEVACIYGQGFRQRDAAWVLGAELVELIGRFPLSRESLSEGLKQITALPLHNEYDRIYLYRCLASHRSTHLRLPDPAMLTRREREQIAAALEHFFTSHIHGATPVQISKWREGFEERFDLRLNLTGDKSSTSGTENIFSGLVSLGAFLTSAAGISGHRAISLVRHTSLAKMLTEADREEFLPQLEVTLRDRRFEPPNLEPSSPVTDAFLRDLSRVVVQLTSELLLSADDQMEQLVVETGAYFRRSADEMKSMMVSAWTTALKEQAFDNSSALVETSPDAIRVVLAQRREPEKLAFCYPDVLLRISAEHAEALPNACLAGFIEPASSSRRTVLIRWESETPVLWSCRSGLTIRREAGILIDSAAVSGGEWFVLPVSTKPLAIVVSGSIRGGRYKSYFRPLLEFA